MVLWDLQAWIPLLAAMHPPMVSGPRRIRPPLQYCSKKARAMVSKPIADYAGVPSLHAAVFLVRAGLKNTNFSFPRGQRSFGVARPAV